VAQKVTKKTITPLLRAASAPRFAERRKKMGRTRVTNGRDLLPGVDGRSYWVRRCRDLISIHLADLGGASNCSAGEHSIIRRIAVLTTELEILEAKFATAGAAMPDDRDLYIRGTGNLRRLLVGAAVVHSSEYNLLKKNL
jgi:hypothetical protein